MSDHCERCGGPLERRHHPTGRDEADRYLDPDFKQGLCHDCHELVHDDWRTLRLEEAPYRLTWFERVALRLRRWALSCARTAELNRDHPFYAWVARVLGRWADELDRGIRRLDEGYAGWRDDPGFYPADPDDSRADD